jgi:DinB superfamily
MDLRSWVLDDHRAVLERMERGVLSLVPAPRWTEHVDAGGSSIAWLLFHVAYHQDVASGLVMGRAPLIAGRRRALGLDGAAPVVGIGESEIPGVTESLDPVALERYLRDVHDGVTSWLFDVDPGAFSNVPDSGAYLSDVAGIAVDDASWLHAMWVDRPAGWFVQWEAIGHGHTHVGEMVSIRNRMGLSPF